MPRVACNRQNPHLVVPHLIVRTPLPAGTEVVRRTEIDRVEDLIACNRLRIETLEAWKTTVDASIVSIWERINTVIEPYLVPAGTIVMWPAMSVPAGWLVCDGTLLVRTEHATLFSKIGTAFNTGGEAVTEFRLPNFEKRFVRGWESGVWGADANLFDAMTAAPVDEASIFTSNDGGNTHNHGLGSGWNTNTVANHEHPITVNSANASHQHSQHRHAISTETAHAHGAGIEYGEPSGGYGLTSEAGEHYHNSWRFFDLTHNFAHGDPELPWNVPVWSDPDPYDPDWISEQPSGYNAYTDSQAGHKHIIPPTKPNGSHNHGGYTIYAQAPEASANHSHTGSSSGAGSHNHSITKPANTEDKTIGQHSHIVSKLTGWDDETRPEGIWMNFIIKR